MSVLWWLYDKLCGKEPAMKTIRDLETVMTDADIITWLKTKDPTETYEYGDTHRCLVAQFLTAKGFMIDSVGGFTVTLNGHLWWFPKTLNRHPWHARTFGAALTRYLET